MRARLALVVALSMLLCRGALADPTGSMRGRVTDADTLEPLVGADVVVTSPALQGERTTVTVEGGRFLLTGLPPGVYSARFVFATIASERAGIPVRTSRRVVVNARLSSARIQVRREEPVFLVDDTTGIGTHVGADTIASLPYRTRDVTETFDLMPTPFATPLVAVDGLNVGDPAFRTPGARLVLEFVAELDLSEGGWNAEVGRSAGGAVNVVTKSGSNRLTGSVFSTLRPGALAGDPVYAAATGAWLVQRQALSFYTTTGFELGGALVADRLWFHVGYAPEILSQRWSRRVRRGFAGEDQLDPADSDGDGIVAEPNGVPDGLQLDPWGRPVTRPAPGGDTELTSLTVAHHFHTKLSHRIDANHSHSLTFFGAPTEFDGVVEDPFDPRSPHASLNGDEDTFAFDGFTGNLSGAYNYAGSFLDDQLGVEVFLGWHHQERRYALKQRTDDPLVVFAEPRALAAVQGNLPAACAAGELFDDGSQHCMVSDYAMGGFGGGALAGELLNRWAERAAVTRRFTLAGHHELEAGIDFEQTEYKSRHHIPGAGTYVYERTRARFVGTELFRDDQISARSTARTVSLDFAAFLQDSWTPAHQVTVNYGLRWQGQQLYAPVDDHGDLERVLGIYDGIAPRLGAAWDFLGDGRSRLFAHWGRYLVPIPLRMADRTFAGIDTRPVEYDSSTCVNESGAPIAAANVIHPARQCAAVPAPPRADLAGVATPGLEGEHSDELLAGLEIEPWPTWSFAVSGVWRSLGQSVAEIVTENGLVLANPGDFDAGHRDQLDAAIAATRDEAERAALVALRANARGINDLPRSEREQWGLRFVVDKRISQRFVVRGSYFLSWTHGNTLAALTSPIDSPMSSGPLPTDRRHRIKLDGFYVFDVRDTGIPLVTTLGGSARITSGAPIDVLAINPSTGAGTHLLPRGEGGRTPWVWSVDLHLATRYHFDPRFALELFVEVFNLFNRREPVAMVSAYTYDQVEPIPGGTADDLEHARTTDGQAVRKNQSYGEPLVFQQPFGASLGLRLLF